MITPINNIGGKIVKENKTYLVKDNTLLNDLVVSSTTLYSNKSTTGHRHKGQEEVYMIMTGNGYIYLDAKVLSIQAGDMVLIEDGVFHKVRAGESGLYFVCIFTGSRQTK